MAEDEVLDMGLVGGMVRAGEGRAQALVDILVTMAWDAITWTAIINILLVATLVA